jgi:hypothetical protein
VSTAVQMAALAMADFLMGEAPGLAPFRVAALLLSVKGHQQAGNLSLSQARNLNRLSRKMIGKLNAEARAKGLDYDLFEIVEFSSFDGLLAVRPRSGAAWSAIVLVTHATGEQSPLFTGGISFGRETFAINGSGINDLLDAINVPKRKKSVARFRTRFEKTGTLTIVACGVGSTGPDVAHYVRELFAVEGRTRFPLVNVDFFADGSLGTPKDPEDTPPWALRALKVNEWRELPSKDEALAARDPVQL